MTIAKKIYFTLLVGLFVGLLVKEFIMDKQLQITQYNSAKSEAQELRNSIMVFRDYIAKLNENNGHKDELQKAHPLNTVIESNFINNSKRNIKIKTASNKPILSANLANEHESDDIYFFDKNKDIDERFSIYNINKTEYYHYSYALRLDQKCLSCHSDYNVGETRGIISIYIPKKNFDKDRVLLSNNSYTVTFIVLMIIFIILYFTVIKPLSKNMKKFQNNLGQFFAYINDEEDEIEFKDIKSSDELGIMSKEIHANIIKARMVIQNQKESHEKLQKLMNEEDHQDKDGIKSKEKRKSDRSKSINMLVNNISTNLHTPLKDLKKHLQEIDKNDDSIDNAMDEIECIEDVLTQYKFFFEQEDIKKEIKLQNIIKKCNTKNHFEYKKLAIEVIDDYEDINLTTYEQELYQVLVNILSTNISNLEVSPYKEKLILISTTKSDSKITISIKDNGGGFDQIKLDKLFNPQIKNVDKLNSDSLKLYISKEIIINHLEGDLEVVNIDIDYKGKTFKGSEFILSIHDS